MLANITIFLPNYPYFLFLSQINGIRQKEELWMVQARTGKKNGKRTVSHSAHKKNYITNTRIHYDKYEES